MKSIDIVGIFIMFSPIIIAILACTLCFINYEGCDKKKGIDYIIASLIVLIIIGGINYWLIIKPFLEWSEKFSIEDISISESAPHYNHSMETIWGIHLD